MQTSGTISVLIEIQTLKMKVDCNILALGTESGLLKKI